MSHNEENTAMTENWKKRIRDDYQFILPEKVIQGTIRYWEEFIRIQRLEAIREFIESLKEHSSHYHFSMMWNNFKKLSDKNGKS